MENTVVRIRRNHVQGLGVVSDSKILTCAHLCLGMLPDQSSCCEFQVIHGTESLPAVTVTVDFAFDFMVLGSETLAGTSCSDPESWEIIDALDSPVPVSLEYPGTVLSAVLKGYFFAPDGKTRIDTDIRTNRGSPFITLSAKVDAGSSGSPVFTTQNHLIGVLTNAWGADETGCGVLIEEAMSCWIRKTYDDLPILPIDDEAEFVRFLIRL